MTGTPSRLLAALVIAVLMSPSLAVSATSPDPIGIPEHSGSYEPPARGPLTFEPNVGQADPAVRYLARGSDALFLFTTSSVYRFVEGEEGLAGARLDFSSRHVEPSASGLRPGVHNYIIGASEEDWALGVPLFGAIRYDDIEEGIDAVFYGTPEGDLEYDFVVHPGADPSSIRLRFDRADRLDVAADGCLLFEKGRIQETHRRPVAYQVYDGERRTVQSRFVKASTETVAFGVGPYDPTRTLVIDPVVEYSTYLGGSGFLGDRGQDISVDAGENYYVTGYTGSTDFPALQAYQGTMSSTNYDAFVAKFGPANDLVYSTFFGGAGREFGYAIAADDEGRVTFAGNTESSPSTFPLKNALQTTNAWSNGGFVARLDASGQSLEFSTFLGGNREDGVRGIALDATGNVVVTGTTFSPLSFPLVNAAQTTYGGAGDLFVTKFAVTAGVPSYVFSTYFGGVNREELPDIAIGSDGSTYVVMATESTDLPVTVNALQSSHGGGTRDAAMIKYTPSGALDVVTYHGGDGDDRGRSIAVEGTAVFLVGETSSSNMVLVDPIQSVRAGSSDGFVTQLPLDLASVIFATLLGGSSVDLITDVSVLAPEQIWLAGQTSSTDFPVASATQSEPRGAAEAIVVRMDPTAPSIDFATYLSGSDGDGVEGAALVGEHSFIVTGVTISADFPITTNALQPTYGGTGDGFITRYCIDTPTTPCEPPSEPRGLHAGPGPQTGEIVLTWQAPERDGNRTIFAYQIYRGEGDATPQPLVTVGNVTSFVDHPPNLANTYDYEVAAVNSVGEGPRAGPVCTSAIETGREACSARDPLYGLDTDDDGLSDSEEVRIHSTDPEDADTDRDGLSDSQEIVAHRSDPVDADTDDDGLDDATEVYLYESDPNAPDTDADGLDDAADPTPTRESIPPGYSDVLGRYLRFSSDGIIDLVVQEANPEEATLSGVLLYGALDAEGPDGALPEPLRFLVPARRSVEGLWSARYVLPPGIERVSEETLGIAVLDRAYNVWTTTQSFDHSLSGRVWAETWNTTATHLGYSYVADGIGPGSGPPASALASSTTWTYASTGSSTSTFTPGVVSATVEEGSFVPVPEAVFLAAGGPPTTGQGPYLIGASESWGDYVDPGLQWPPRVPDYSEPEPDEYAAVVFGEGQLAANDEFVAVTLGFTVIGDLSECSKPFTGQEYHLSFVVLGCASLVATVVTFGGSSAVVGMVRGADDVARAARATPELATDLAQAAEACVRRGDACEGIAETAARAQDAVAVTRVALLESALGRDAYVRLATKYPVIVDRLQDIESGLRAGGLGDTKIRETYARAYRASDLGEADDTFFELTNLHKTFFETPALRGRPEVAAKVFADASQFAHVHGAERFVTQAKLQVNADKGTKWDGFAFEAEMNAKLVGSGLDEVTDKFPAYAFEGHSVRPEIDGWRQVAEERRLVDYKSGALDAKQLEKQMVGIETTSPSAARTIEWHVRQQPVDPRFIQDAQVYCTRHQFSLEIYDSQGGIVQRIDP